MTEQHKERRLAGRRINDTATEELLNSMQALIGLLTMHVHNQEASAAELKQMVDEYFQEIDPPTHRKHHDFVTRKMRKNDHDEEAWDKIKMSLREKAIIFAFAAIMSYLGAILWTDFADRVNKTPVITREEQKTHKYEVVTPPLP